MLDEKIKNELAHIVGPENFTEAKIDMVSYAYDAMGSKGAPDCAVWVTTAAQVSKIMQLAHRERNPVIPRAAGTGIAGMAVPSHGGIVLDIMRMNRILEVNIEDRICMVEPGVVYANLQKELAPLGFTIPQFIGHLLDRAFTRP